LRQNQRIHLWGMSLQYHPAWAPSPNTARGGPSPPAPPPPPAPHLAQALRADLLLLALQLRVKQPNTQDGQCALLVLGLRTRSRVEGLGRGARWGPGPGCALLVPGCGRGPGFSGPCAIRESDEWDKARLNPKPFPWGLQPPQSTALSRPKSRARAHVHPASAHRTSCAPPLPPQVAVIQGGWVAPLLAHPHSRPPPAARGLHAACPPGR
jgi:hypothetical protein